MGVLLGGDKAWKVRNKGDLNISYEWINNEPAMCVYPAIRRNIHQGALVIPIEAAWKYANANGEPNVEYITAMAIKACQHMGMQPEKSVIHRIIDVIVDGLPDLVEMPPEPPSHQIDRVNGSPKVGDLVIKVDGETILETEVNDLQAGAVSGAIN